MDGGHQLLLAEVEPKPDSVLNALDALEGFLDSAQRQHFASTMAAGSSAAAGTAASPRQR